MVQVVTTKNTIAIQHKSSGMVGFGPAVGAEYVHDDGSFSPVVGFQVGDVDASAQLWNGNYQVMVGAGDISEGFAGNLPQYLTFATTGQKLQELGGLNGFRDTYAQGYELTSAQYFYGTDKYTGVQQMYFYLNFHQIKHESRK